MSMDVNKTLNKKNYQSAEKIQNYESDDPGVFNKANDKRVKKLVKNFTKLLSKKNKALDVGCGSGNVYFKLEPFFEKVYGLDISTKMAIEKGITPNLLYEGDCENMPYDKNSFDAMTAYGVVHHLEDPIHFFKEAHRTLRDGGIFYIDNDKNKVFFQVYVNLMYIVSKIKNENTKYWEDFFVPHAIEEGEYHFGGFYYSDLLSMLSNAGFRQIFLRYRMTNNPKFKNNIVHRFLKFFRLKYFYTHLYAIAIK